MVDIAIVMVVISWFINQLITGGPILYLLHRIEGSVTHPSPGADAANAGVSPGAPASQARRMVDFTQKYCGWASEILQLIGGKDPIIYPAW